MHCEIASDENNNRQYLPRSGEPKPSFSLKPEDCKLKTGSRKRALSSRPTALLRLKIAVHDRRDLMPTLFSITEIVSTTSMRFYALRDQSTSMANRLTASNRHPGNSMSNQHKSLHENTSLPKVRYSSLQYRVNRGMCLNIVASFGYLGTVAPFATYASL